MGLLTLLSVRQSLWQYGSSVPYATATTQDKSNFDAVVNQVVERFLLDGKWRGTFKRVTLRTYGNTLTLPRNLESCLGCDPLTSQGQNVIGLPLMIYSRWFEFAAGGIGLTSSNCLSCAIRGLVQQSDNVQTFNDPTGTFYIRAKATEVSAGGFTLAGGFDQNSSELFANITLAFANGTTTTTQQYTAMPLIQKVVTTNAVSMYSVDVTSGVETLLCVYAPGETVPAYKRYVMPSAQDGDTFLAFCKLAYVPAVADTDIIIPSVTGALKLGLMSLQFEDRNDLERAASYMNQAIALLDADMQELNGAEIPPFNMVGFGAGDVVNVM